MVFFAQAVLIKLSENMIKRSKLSSEELIVEAIEKAERKMKREKKEKEKEKVNQAS